MVFSQLLTFFSLVHQKRFNYSTMIVLKTQCVLIQELNIVHRQLLKGIMITAIKMSVNCDYKNIKTFGHFYNLSFMNKKFEPVTCLYVFES